MEQKISSSHRRGDLSASDSGSDPEREFSGDDDDDRNHKHRRREIRPQSSEFDAPQSVSSKPFNKRNKSFQNGNSFRRNGSRMNGEWKNNSELLKHDRRNYDMPVYSRPQMDIDQRYGLGQTNFGGSVFARGRGRDFWNAHAPGFGSLEFSHAASHGSGSSNLYAGRGVSNVAGIHTAAWNQYGLLPEISTGGLDAVHSLGVNPSHSGIIRQKCRDFEERGFCLRGDMCPMEHGVNRIVVDDVQSLSEFNLPVSFPEGNRLGGGSGPIQAGTSSTNFSVNNTKTSRKMGKSKAARKGINSDAVGLFSNSAAAAAALNDYYDPDQPLLSKSGPESSTILSQPVAPEIQQEEPILGGDPSSENPDEVLNSSSYKSKKNEDTNISDASRRRMKGSSCNGQKPQQKAMRTIFVNGIPQKDNNIQALRLHFQKFGKIIDIYIPANGERAFVQFSTREEAEAALIAPDAVMGNRFIKLWWANRDSVPDTGSSGGGSNPYVNPLANNAYSGPNTSSINSKGRSNILPASKVSATLASSSTPKVAPSQKKQENLEVLKEELRKKQELLEQKRNEFKRQLEKLEKQKQGAGVKCESSLEHPAKRQKTAVTADVAKRTAPQFADAATSITLTEAEELAAKVKPVQDPKTVLAETDNVLINNSKLDTQPRSFKIIPPLPSDIENIVILREHFSLYGEVYDVELVNADSDECPTVIISFDTHLSAEKAFHCGKNVNGHDLQFAWVGRDIGEHDKISSSLAPEEPMDVDTALQIKDTVSQPDLDSKATAAYIIDKVAVSEKNLIQHEELVEDQPEDNDDFMKHEEQVSEEGYAEKADDEKSHSEYSLKTRDNQDAVRAYEKPLSGDEFQKSCEPHIDVDNLNGGEDKRG